MKLSTIRSEIDAVILERGREYQLDGRILELAQTPDGTYRALVQGYDLYHVEITLAEDATILSWDCDCPYDFGPVCKHEAAVLLQLSGDDFSSESRLRDGQAAIYAMTEYPEKDLKSALEIQSKERLIDLIMTLASDSSIVEQRIRLCVSTTNEDLEIEECRTYIRSYIESCSDRRGFVSYRNASRAVAGAYHIGERVQEAVKDNDCIRALRLAFCILDEMLDLLGYADDSDGSIGSVIDDSIEQIRAISLAVKGSDTSDHAWTFLQLLQKSNDSKLDGWTDWRLDLLGFAAKLATTADMRREWESHADRMTSLCGGSDWTRGHLAERIAMMRYGVILEYDGEEQAAAYVQDHLHLPDFRRLSIREALEHQRFDKVIQLTSEGESGAQRAGFRGLVREWRQLRYEAYRRSGQLAEERQLGLELVLDGEFSFYHSVKKTYPPTQWPSVYQYLVQRFEEQGNELSVYARILVEERDTRRLLAYVSRQPSLIETYYQYLVPEYLAEVTSLFLTNIRERAARSSTRDHYREVCEVIRKLKEAGGPNSAENIVLELLETYPRRPAFREELLKVRR